MSNIISLLSLAIFLIMFFPLSVGAVWTDLTAEQVYLAIAYGKVNKDVDYVTFFKEWRVDLGYGKGSARVITPFSTIAFESKNLPFESVKITPDDIKKLTADLKDRLAFGVSVYGEETDFAKDCHAVLKHHKQSQRPTEERHQKIAETTQSWPQSPAYKAICYYYFDLHRVDPNDIVTLAVSIPKEKSVEFTFDLSKMR